MAPAMSFVPKNTKSKNQITNKSQIQITNHQNLPGQERLFGFLYLVIVIFLIFGISMSQRNFN
jgi:hypothetical protein